MSVKDETQIPDYQGNENYWRERWLSDKIGFHRDSVNTNLIENLPRLIKDETDDGDNNKSTKIFVPFCGKSLDIGYLLQEGHQVIAVEVVSEAIKALDAEGGFRLRFNESESTYHTEDEKLVIFCGDLFKAGFQEFIGKYGPVNAIWDRGAFIALTYDFRAEYVKMMQSALRTHSGEYTSFRYLLEALDYDRENFAGPPRAVSQEDMEKYFADWTNIELLSRNIELKGSVPKVPGIGKVEQVVYMLSNIKK